MKKKVFLTLCLSLMLLAGCDDGDITNDNVLYTRTGRTLNLSADISGINSWADGYNVVVAGFSDSEYADISKNIQSDGKIKVQLAGINSSVKTLKICVVNRLRVCVATFYSFDCSKVTDDEIILDAGNVNVGMMQAVKNSIFSTTCVTCHGSSKGAAAGLFLTDSLCYNALVNHRSARDTSSCLVVPGQPDSSFLLKVLKGEVMKTHDGITDTLVKFDHINMIPNYLHYDLLESWIETGANN